MSRFDPDAGKDYAACKNCAETFPTRVEMSEHLHSTFTNGRSHSASIKNQTRAERIKNELDDLMQDALYEFMDSAGKLVDDEGVTEEEISEAMRSVDVDLVSAWEQNS